MCSLSLSFFYVTRSGKAGGGTLTSIRHSSADHGGDAMTTTVLLLARGAARRSARPKFSSSSVGLAVTAVINKLRRHCD